MDTSSDTFRSLMEWSGIGWFLGTNHGITQTEWMASFAVQVYRIIFRR